MRMVKSVIPVFLTLCSTILTTSAIEFVNEEYWRYLDQESKRSTGFSGNGGASSRQSLPNRIMNAFQRPAALKNTPFIRNPNFANVLGTYDSCKTVDGEYGICHSTAFCTLGGGKVSGACLYGLACCVNAVSKCSSASTLNNTYWHSRDQLPLSTTSCGLTITLDQSLAEQRKMRICQVRLDFLSFSISQPNSESVCDTDSFQVTGGLNDAPLICGDNDGQHMYIHVPDSGSKRSDITLSFNFKQTPDAVRRWRIKVAYLPCGANYLAPVDCLQYFTGVGGQVRSFNWADTAWTATRQLANQDYKICYRREKLIQSNKLANSICFRVCQTTNGMRPFSLTGVDRETFIGNLNTQSQSDNKDFCKYDYLVILGGVGDSDTLLRDRYCGGQLNAKANLEVSQTICSSLKPFRILYHTNECETCTSIAEQSQKDTNGKNVGFCLNYLQTE